VTLRILGRLSSINVQKVVWCADELGLKYERTDVGGSFGGNKSPEYLALNPNGLVPTIDEDGFILYESNAIVRYLAGRYSKSALWPEDLRRRADVDRWMEWLSTSLVPAMRDAFWQLIRTPEDKRDRAAVEKSRADSERLMAILDAQLARREHVTDNGFTTADIVIGCAAHRWLHLPLERIARPNVERWYAMLKSRPGSRQVTSQSIG
jgi:glutathione S-transferase